MSETSPPCTIVIFGAVGDLTQRLLIPSIYNLAVAGLLDERTRIIGADHHDRDAASWTAELDTALHRFALEKGAEFHATIDDAIWSSLARRLDYQRFDFTDDANYRALAQRLDGAANVLFYCAVSPRFFEPIAAGLARVGLLAQSSGGFRRIIVEKPFGRDLESARALNAKLTSLAADDQLYRIDHFLGKEAVAGIPALRFASNVIEPLLSRDTIAGVQITAAETVGVEERGKFYESIGALRDMVPNHLFSLMTLVAMEKPRGFDAHAMRDAKLALLDAIRPLNAGDAVRAQYASGTVDGEAVRAYRDEDDVAHDSRTETYAALRVEIDNDRWRGVPFYIRTGKRMRAHVTTIALTLRTPVRALDTDPAAPHLLVLGVDPQRGFVQRFAAKRPGVQERLGPASASFRYDTTFDEAPNVGYEALLFDALRGSAINFQRADMIEREWAVLQPLLDDWAKSSDPLPTYASGSDGPADADALLTRDGQRWLDVAPMEKLGAADAPASAVAVPA